MPVQTQRLGDEVVLLRDNETAARRIGFVCEPAQHFGARYVVISERFGLYPGALKFRRGRGVELRLDAPGVRTYELTGVP